ncbi:uncharacterized protein THITE_2083919 [Thermothielavioides terrestris NRRL 8126]|uniref:Uncharacterized protein n=1 Tax=Thermothielavioides terrestris (strain ATCC 38088 / NRRL 8126) TaxID=578455 RepID=G2QQI2_THETT|nr:uncharacterized protein THITE_2083919 [Thermothielavioides terrestris NRRL 8126]AEO62392.1 hypothetical protein THITE_2083919 [Thermothielavioides terrestris NRRL 8126]
MSCNNRTPQRNHQESASMFDSDRILDRKIERQALPGSFSSNIGRKPPSPENKASVRSVRAMVRLFEQSARSSDSAKPQASRPSQASDTSGRAGGGSDGSEGCRAHHDNDNKDHEPVVRHTEPSMFPAALAFGCQVEEYSLTLLKHKSYFNNRPLARCLDDFCAKEKDSKPERVRAARDQANEPAVEKKRGNANGGKEGQADQGTCPITPPNRNQTSSPIQQLDSLRSGLLSWQGESERDTPGPGHKWTERDPREVDRFWCKVRTELWLDEDEIYAGRTGPADIVGVETSAGQDEYHSSESAAYILTPPLSDCSSPEQEHPILPAPTRPPPPVPTAARRQFDSIDAPRGRQRSTTSLHDVSDQDQNCPAWDEPPPAAFPRLNISAPSEVPIGDLLSEGYLYPEPELPALSEPDRPLPVPETSPRHSRHTSRSSGPWMHPPTWRSPFPLSSSSPPPPVPPLPALPPPSVSSASATTTTTNHYRRHVRHRHQPHSSKASTSISISTHSVAATDGRSSDASGSAQSMHSRERTHKTSTSSTATRSSRSGSSADLSAHRHHHYPPRTAPRRRLTAEEKLSEIDAFLSSDPERED